MKKFTAFVLCAFLCLGLTACGSASTDSQKNNTTKQDDVAKTGGYVFETKGKQIAMDADFAEIAKELGEPIKYYEAASCAFEGLDKTYTYDGFKVDTYPDEKSVDRVADVIFTDDTVKTKEGAHLGMTADDIKGIYGSYGTENDKSITYEKGDMKLIFILTDGKVTSIQYVSKVLD